MQPPPTSPKTRQPRRKPWEQSLVDPTDPVQPGKVARDWRKKRRPYEGVGSVTTLWRVAEDPTRHRDGSLTVHLTRMLAFTDEAGEVEAHPVRDFDAVNQRELSLRYHWDEPWPDWVKTQLVEITMRGVPD